MYLNFLIPYDFINPIMNGSVSRLYFYMFHFKLQRKQFGIFFGG